VKKSPVHLLRLCYNGSINNEKGTKMTEFESKCYGMTTEAIRQQYMRESIMARFGGLEMVVMGILSDAQELQSFGHAQALDQSRKQMNIAKFILSEMMEAREKEAA
jgi:hypothetical protein